MKLGISSYTLTWGVGVPGYEHPDSPVTAIDLIRLASQERLTLVQLADNIPLHRFRQDELYALKLCAGENGIELEVGTRGTDPEHLRNYLRIACLLGANLVRTLITTQNMEEAADHLEEIIPAYAAERITLAIENHGLHTTKQMTGLFDRLNSPYVGCCLDTVNSFGAMEDPQRVIDALAPYTVNLHIKDFDIQRVDHQMGFIVLGTPAGSGRLDLDYVLAGLERSGKAPTAILELWTPYSGSVLETVRLERQWLAESLRYLKNYSFH